MSEDEGDERPPQACPAAASKRPTGRGLVRARREARLAEALRANLRRRKDTAPRGDGINDEKED